MKATTLNKAVIFDLDGTVLDSIDDIVDCVNVTLERFSFETLSKKEIKQYIGNGAKNLIRCSLKKSVDEIQLAHILNYYNDIYTASSSAKTCVFNNIDKVLSALKQRQYKIGILTNKPQKTTDSLAKRFLANFGFDLIIGQREGVPIKPNPLALTNMLISLNAEPKLSYFVGDGEADAILAKNAQVQGISVLYGYREKNQLEKVGATVFANTPMDLLDIIS